MVIRPDMDVAFVRVARIEHAADFVDVVGGDEELAPVEPFRLFPEAFEDAITGPIGFGLLVVEENGPTRAADSRQLAHCAEIIRNVVEDRIDSDQVEIVIRDLGKVAAIQLKGGEPLAGKASPDELEEPRGNVSCDNIDIEGKKVAAEVARSTAEIECSQRTIDRIYGFAQSSQCSGEAFLLDGIENLGMPLLIKAGDGVVDADIAVDSDIDKGSWLVHA